LNVHRAALEVLGSEFEDFIVGSGPLWLVPEKRFAEMAIEV
jgi:hypothetical protein